MKVNLEDSKDRSEKKMVKHKALKERQAKEKHEHRYKHGECVHCGKEENVEWEGEKGGRETGKEA